MKQNYVNFTERVRLENYKIEVKRLEDKIKKLLYYVESPFCDTRRYYTEKIKEYSKKIEELKHVISTITVITD